jgi:tetratricopeptide (TPR) repeat protein
MKKKYLQLILPFLFLVAVGFVILSYKSKQKTAAGTSYKLLPRNSNHNDAEWQMANKNINKLIAKIKADPGDVKSQLALTNAYIVESRISGNFSYYDNAALKTIDKLLLKDPANYEALMLKSLVQLSQHHFNEALTTARASLSIDSNSAFIYGLLVDAYVELGNYEAAVDAADKMINRRPDLRSYSRIAYLREIHGDYPGAIEAMEMAVAAGVASEETTEWCRTQLGKLYENVGEISKASFQYQLSLAARPGYANALAGLARIAAFEKKYDSAAYYYEQASKYINDIGMKQQLIAIYEIKGDIQKAGVLKKEIKTEISRAGNPAVDMPDMGHYADKEMAYAYIQLGDTDKALAHAMAEFKRRPDNIDVNETMAWVHYKRNEAEKALPYINNALYTNSKNPVLLAIAGLIYLKAGDNLKGKELLEIAFYNNPVLQIDVKKEIDKISKD